MKTKKRVTDAGWSLSAFARKVGVSNQAVSKAVAGGQLAGVVAWVQRRGKRTPVIVDVPRALELWRSRPQSHTPGLAADKSAPEVVPQLGDLPGPIEDSRRALEHFRAKAAQLAYEQDAGKLISLDEAKSTTIRMVTEARNAFLALPNRLRNQCPEITFAVTDALDKLVREILTDLADMPAAVEKIARPAGKGRHS